MSTSIRIWLGVVTCVLMVAALFMVFFHVPSAWVAFAAFALVAISGVFFLWLGQQVWDDLGYAAAESGMVFCTLVLITGSIWAKPIWGAWWTWDSRLTTTLILWLLYGGYLMLRAMADDTPQVARFAAVVGIAAALDVPIIIVSVRLWRTIHPAVLLTRQGGHGLEDSRMIAALLISIAAFTVLFIWLLLLRVGIVRNRSRLMSLRHELESLELRG